MWRELQAIEGFIDKCANLEIVDPTEDFIVCIDACNEGLDVVLTQNGHVLYYESRKLREHKKNYAAHDLELAIFIYALNIWRHYLMGKKFELKTNHSGLKYLFGQPTLNAREIRWLEFLSEYVFDIKHIKGKENKVVDALNKRAHEMHATAISMFMCTQKGTTLQL